MLIKTIFNCVVCFLNLTLQAVPVSYDIPIVSFDQAMVCNSNDTDEYFAAYTSTSENKSFFDFARTHYETYIKQQHGYSDTPRIPKIIHQIWIGPNKPPKQFKEWQQTWLNLHPDWEYRLWTDAEVEHLQMLNRQYYEQEENFGAKADILRLEILNQFGGLYADVDFECLKSFDPLHHLCDFYIGFFQVNFLKSSARINNAIMAAHPNHPVIQLLINELATHQLKVHKKVIDRAGPGFVTRILKQSMAELTGINVILPANYLYPWSGTRKNLKLCLQEETMAIHHYSGTWHSSKQLKRSNTSKNRRAYFKEKLHKIFPSFSS